MSPIRIGIIVILSVVLFLALSFYAVTYLIFKISLARKSYAGEQVKKRFGGNLEAFDIDRSFWNKHKVEELMLKNQDGAVLKGFLVKSKQKTNKLAVVVHGYYSKHEDMAIQARIFNKLGFDVFCPDLFGHGKSEGGFVNMGLNDARDVSDWCKKFIKENPNVEIVVFGWSMGGATSAIMSGLYDLKNVKTYIVECPYSSAYEEFAEILKERKLSSKLILPFGEFASKMYCGYSLKNANPEKYIALSSKPMLFIHGDADTFVPYYMGKKVFDAKNKGTKEFVTFEGADHCMCYKTDKKRYEKVITEWINKYIN